MDKNIEKLRNLAYGRCIESRDFAKVDKIIDGICKGSITKENLYDSVRKLTKNVTSEHSIRRWGILTEWFDSVEWC